MVRIKSSQNAKSIKDLREMVETPKMVGDAQDIIPFAWRNPIVIKNTKKTSRVLKALALNEQLRTKA